MRRTLFEGDLPGFSDPSILFLLGSLLSYGFCASSRAPEPLKKYRPELGFIVLAALAGALGLVHSLKWVIGRARPYEVWSGEWLYTPWFSFGPHFVTEGVYHGSFPSGHTAAVLTLLMIPYLLWWSPKPGRGKQALALLLGLLVLGAAGAMGVGRSMTAHHWLTDSLGMILPTWAMLHWVHQHLLKTPQQRLYVALNGTYPSLPPYWELRFAGWGFLFVLGVMGILLGIRSITFQDPPLLLGLTPLGGLLSAWAITQARALHLKVLHAFFEPLSATDESHPH